MLDRTISCGAVNLIWDKSLSHMGESSLMWDRADSPTRFVTSFKIILKLVEFFTSVGQSEKIFRILRKVHKHLNFIQNYSEGCRIFYKLRAVYEII